MKLVNLTPHALTFRSPDGIGQNRRTQMGNEITKATMDVVGNCVATRIAVMRKELGDEEVEYSEEYQHLVAFVEAAAMIHRGREKKPGSPFLLVS